MKMSIVKEVTPIEGGFQVKFKASYLMKSVYLYANTDGTSRDNREGVFDKNYFDILPNRDFIVTYKTTAKFDDFVNSLEVKSLVDTY